MSPKEESRKVREGTGPLRTCARMFLTVTPGVADVYVRGLGRVLEDGDVPCHGNHTEHSRKVREGDWSAEEMCVNVPHRHTRCS